MECLDLSYNEFDPVLIYNIFDFSEKIQKVYLINNLIIKDDLSLNLVDFLKTKLKDQRKTVLKCFEIMCDHLSDVYEIKNLLQQRWKNKTIYAKFITKNIIEFITS